MMKRLFLPKNRWSNGFWVKYYSVLFINNFNSFLSRFCALCCCTGVVLYDFVILCLAQLCNCSPLLWSPKRVRAGTTNFGSSLKVKQFKSCSIRLPSDTMVIMLIGVRSGGNLR